MKADTGSGILFLAALPVAAILLMASGDKESVYYAFGILAMGMPASLGLIKGSRAARIVLVVLCALGMAFLGFLAVGLTLVNLLSEHSSSDFWGILSVMGCLAGILLLGFLIIRLTRDP